MSYQINNHRLSGTNVDFKQSDNHSGKFKSGKLDTIIIHYTAGASRSSSVATLRKPGGASAHIVVGRDEKITQLVNFDTIAWHAGTSSYGNRSGFNNFSIGIEIDNAGIMTKIGDSYVTGFGTKYPSENVVAGTHRNRNVSQYWHKYTQWQLDTVEEICKLLIQKYNIKFILGHEEISPDRKIDPGPGFPLDEMRNRLLNGGQASSGGQTTTDQQTTGGTATPLSGNFKVNADSLNIRKQPDASAPTVTDPLKKGTTVTAIEEKDGWVKVKTEVVGWVNKKYLT